MFSRKEMPRYQPVDLNRVLDHSGALLHRLLGEHVELRIVPAEAPVCISADESNLSQIIMHLQFLPKPFTAAGIIKAVSTVLASKSAALAP